MTVEAPGKQSLSLGFHGLAKMKQMKLRVCEKIDLGPRTSDFGLRNLLVFPEVRGLMSEAQAKSSQALRPHQLAEEQERWRHQLRVPGYGHRSGLS